MTRARYDFSSHTLVLTGTCGSIGRAIARRFYDSGANCVLTDLDQAGVSAFAEELDPTGGRVLALALDVTDPAKVNAVMQAGHQKFGPIHALVTSAGLYDDAMVADMPDTQWQRSIAINLDSVFYTWRSPCTGLVDMAANLLDANGLAKKGMELKSACGFDGGQKTSNSYVKCSTIEPFGYVLHAVEDFYSHSNYSDGSDPTKPVGVSNPPGFLPDIPVTAASLPAFWDLSSGTMIDNVNAELFGKGTAWPITGCYPDSSCTNRVLHNNVLTKDLSGGIDYTKGANATIGAPGNPRGATNSNTLRAVRFAILEARRQWEVAQSLLMQRYGEQKGAMMICALTRDNPITCNS